MAAFSPVNPLNVSFNPAFSPSYFSNAETAHYLHSTSDPSFVPLDLMHQASSASGYDRAPLVAGSDTSHSNSAAQDVCTPISSVASPHGPSPTPTDRKELTSPAGTSEDAPHDPNAKPSLSYAALITKAIVESPTHKLTLNSIYNYVQENFPYFRTAPGGWKNSIRHNLSLNKAFQRIPREINEPGKGSYWTIDMNYMDETMKPKGRCGRSTSDPHPYLAGLPYAGSFASPYGRTGPPVHPAFYPHAMTHQSPPHPHNTPYHPVFSGGVNGAVYSPYYHRAHSANTSPTYAGGMMLPTSAHSPAMPTGGGAGGGGPVTGGHTPWSSPRSPLGHYGSATVMGYYSTSSSMQGNSYVGGDGGNGNSIAGALAPQSHYIQTPVNPATTTPYENMSALLDPAVQQQSSMASTQFTTSSVHSPSSSLHHHQHHHQHHASGYPSLHATSMNPPPPTFYDQGAPTDHSSSHTMAAAAAAAAAAGYQSSNGAKQPGHAFTDNGLADPGFTAGHIEGVDSHDAGGAASLLAGTFTQTVEGTSVSSASGLTAYHLSAAHEQSPIRYSSPSHPAH
ncbi:hypothetical protein IWQ60_000283 [Tieghemiomyces parasiticus]|uniref:Fork-head domain-containing protein n=1 Tax=Tieghemiomyces parasiticus TaxID=78921 RepID=A0A9W8E2Y6_9FUNG|nr:hypothetical protein IWQ60_000283 [Tieghemiomyces parasiticus]